MKKIVILIIIALYSTIDARGQDGFVGNWTDEANSQIITIYVEDSNYFGRIIYAKDLPSKEIENKIVLIQMKKRNDNVLYGGTYFDWLIKKEFEVKLKLKNANTIYFTGYHGIFNINRVWHRVL